MFDQILEKLLDLLRNGRARSIIILIVLMFIFLIILLPLIFSAKKLPFRKRPVVCLECENKGTHNVSKLEKCKCPKCSGELVYIYKCLECDYEFPLKRLNKEDIPGIKSMSMKDYINFRIDESKCPNCGSKFTDPKRIKK